MANPLLVAGILRAVTALPGVQDEGHLLDYARGTASAVEASTCTGDWAKADWCRPTWTRPPRELAAALVTKAWFESGLLARIGAGRCLPYECDAYRVRGRIFHRARGYYQIQYSGAVRAHEWHEMVGTDEWSVFVASSTAARLLGNYVGMCGDIPGGFSAYATGGRCSWSRVGPRVTVYLRTLQRINFA